MNNFHILGGLPRSGITLLSAILNVSPEIYVTPTSPFVELLWRNYSLWLDPDYIDDTTTERLQNAKIPFLQKIAPAYFSQFTKTPYIVDKRRQWQTPNNIEMYKEIYGRLPKIVCPVRSVVDVITSYKVLYKKNNMKWDLDSLKGNRFEASYFALKQSYAMYPECFLLVEYVDIVRTPQQIINSICEFLKVPTFDYDKTSPVKAFELEANYGIKGLHELRTKLAISDDEPRNILTDEEYFMFKDWDFWKEDVCTTPITK